MGGDYRETSIRTVLVKRYSSIASKKCTVAIAHAGRATRCALTRFLVLTVAHLKLESDRLIALVLHYSTTKNVCEIL